MRKIRVPNQIVNDEKLSCSARRLAAYFCAVSNRFGYCRKSIAMLAGLTGLSTATVKSAIDELTRAGLLEHKRKYRYDQNRGHLIFDRTEFFINKYVPGGYALIPSDLFQHREITSAAFVVALFLCQQASGRGRAFPSIQRIANSVGIARATVCRALRQIQDAAVFLVRHCLRHNGSYAANSYFLLHQAVPQQMSTPVPKFALTAKFYHWAAEKINGPGSLIFSQPVVGLR